MITNTTFLFLFFFYESLCLVFIKTKNFSDTPGHAGAMTPGWAETPRADRGGDAEAKISDTPSASKRRSRWDLTPSETPSGNQTPLVGAFTPSGPGSAGAFTPAGLGHPMMTPGGSTPIGAAAMGMATPSVNQLLSMTPEQLQAFRWEKEIDERNRPLSDEELDALFPPGYKV